MLKYGVHVVKPARIAQYQFRDFTPDVDHAFRELGSGSEWPLELYRYIADGVPSRYRRIILWVERDEPIGVVVFTLDGRGIWAPVTHWVLPGWLGPLLAERESDLLPMLPFRARIAWWRMSGDVPSGPKVHHASKNPTYALDSTMDFEAYWKKTGQLRSITKARKRCQGLVFKVNGPGAAQWVVNRSDELWRLNPDTPTPQLHARLTAAEYLEPIQRHITLTLQDGDQYVAGDTYLVHRGDLVALNTFRDRRYNEKGVGNRLLDLGCFWARENGFRSIDIGGGFGYKERWAPVGGVKHSLLIASRPQLAAYRASRRMESAWKNAKARAARMFGKIEVAQ